MISILYLVDQCRNMITAVLINNNIEPSEICQTNTFLQRLLIHLLDQKSLTINLNVFLTKKKRPSNTTNTLGKSKGNSIFTLYL